MIKPVVKPAPEMSAYSSEPMVSRGAGADGRELGLQAIVRGRRADVLRVVAALRAAERVGVSDRA